MCDLSLLYKAKLVEKFDKDICVFHILLAGPGKYREDVRLLKNTRYNILL